MTGKAPKLYGIDPTVQYYWTPSKFAKRPQIELDAREDLRKELDGKYGKKKLTEADKKHIEAEFEKISKLYEEMPDAVPADAPVLILAPLDEIYSIRLQAARAAYDRNLSLTSMRIKSRIEQIERATTDPMERADKIAKAERELHEGFLATAYSVYDPKLVYDILANTVKGWINIRAQWTGDWSVDAKALPGEWKHEAFLAILAGNAYTQTELESFTSRPESASA